MLILNENNKTENIFEFITTNENGRLYFCVFDFKQDLNDYYFLSLDYLEMVTTNIFVVKINNQLVFLPRNFKILIGEPFFDKLELLSIEECMDRNFCAFVYNPFSSSKHYFDKLEIMSILPEKKLFLPKLTPTQFILSPVAKNTPNKCVFLSNENCKLETVSINILKN